MIRMVLLLVFGAVAGAGLGTLFGGPMGGVLGILLGVAFAVMWQTARRATRTIPPGAPVFREDRHLLCVPNGRFADVVLEHDGHHWCDVESCTLCHPAERVGCAKRCLDLMNDNHPPRRELATV